MAKLKVDGRVVVRSFGAYLPERVLTNKELIELHKLPVTDSWIRGRIGTEERHWAAPDQAASDLAFEATKEILDGTGISGSDIARIVVATTSGDWVLPSTACALHERLAAPVECAAFDVAAACTGFIYALDVASRAVITGQERVLVVATEVRSRQADPRQGRILPIYGDGAGGFLLEPAEPSKTRGIQACALFAEGIGIHNATIPGGGSRLPLTKERLDEGKQYIEMKDGRAIFERGTEAMVSCAEQVMDLAGWTKEDVDFLIPHQANLSLMRGIRDKLGIAPEKSAEFIQKTGNCSSASIPIALWLAKKAGLVKTGSRIVMTAAGGGYTAGAVALVL